MSSTAFSDEARGGITNRTRKNTHTHTYTHIHTPTHVRTHAHTHTTHQNTTRGTRKRGCCLEGVCDEAGDEAMKWNGSSVADLLGLSLCISI